jgi:hypothetical protein
MLLLRSERGDAVHVSFIAQSPTTPSMSSMPRSASICLRGRWQSSSMLEKLAFLTSYV